jgi:hypothetical protein
MTTTCYVENMEKLLDRKNQLLIQMSKWPIWMVAGTDPNGCYFNDCRSVHTQDLHRWLYLPTNPRSSRTC